MSEIEIGGPAFPTKREALDPRTTGWHTEEGMTLRQHAAIKVRVPDSGETWLDEMIRQSLRDEFAAKAMQGMLSHPHPDHHGEDGIDVLVSDAFLIADAMLAAR